MGTWPSQEWRLPPKQQVEGSNPSVPANKLKRNIIKPLGRQGTPCLRIKITEKAKDLQTAMV